MATIDQVRDTLGDLQAYLDSLDVASANLPDPLLAQNMRVATNGVRVALEILLQRSHQDPSHFDDPIVLTSLTMVGAGLQQAQSEVVQRPREVMAHVRSVELWADGLNGDPTTRPPRW